REIRGDVQREPVPGDPLLHVNPDARDLARPPSRPHTGVAWLPLGGDTQRRQGLDQRLLECAEVPVEVLPVAGQVEDGVADELAGAVERDVAAPLDLEHLEPSLPLPLVRPEQVCVVGVAAQGYDRRVLEQQQQIVRHLPLDPCLRQGALPLERLDVRDDAGLYDLEDTPGHVRHPDLTPVPPLHHVERGPGGEVAIPVSPSGRPSRRARGWRAPTPAGPRGRRAGALARREIPAGARRPWRARRSRPLARGFRGRGSCANRTPPRPRSPPAARARPGRLPPAGSSWGRAAAAALAPRAARR